MPHTPQMALELMESFEAMKLYQSILYFGEYYLHVKPHNLFSIAILVARIRSVDARRRTSCIEHS